MMYLDDTSVRSLVNIANRLGRMMRWRQRLGKFEFLNKYKKSSRNLMQMPYLSLHFWEKHQLQD